MSEKGGKSRDRFSFENSQTFIIASRYNKVCLRKDSKAQISKFRVSFS